MPQVKAEILVPVTPEVAFAVSQTTGAIRKRWDPFIRSQQYLDDATRAAKGVRTLTHSRLGPRMISRYVSFNPPTQAGMTMVRGPWFFDQFGGGWRFVAEGEGSRAIWKYTFSVKPAWLRPLADPIGRWLLGHEIRARLAGFARGCSDPVVLAEAQRLLDEEQSRADHA